MNNASRLRTVHYVIACLTLLVGTSCARAAEPAAVAAAVDPQVTKVLDGLSKYITGLKGFSVAMDVQLQVTQRGTKNAIEFKQKLRAERPNLLAFTVDSEAGSGQLYSDGKESTAYLTTFHKYLVEPAPETWEGMFQNPLAMGVMSQGNGTIAILALLSSDPAKGLLSTAETAKYGGVVKLGDTKCHLIEAIGADFDWKLWIDAGEKPIVRQFIPDLAKSFAKMAAARGGNAAALADLQVSNVVTYKDWIENPQFEEGTFKFQPPEDAEKADSLAEIIQGAGRGAEDAPHPLLSKVAPPIKLDLLGGGKLDLAALKGKNVVILDFWATWCGPCQRAMPIIEKVADNYKDKGVLLYAVNIQETPEEVQKFVDDSGLHLAIALDKDGAVAQAYKAEAIPQTVIVGRDGTVQVVHVGLAPDLEGLLRKELDALVAGKDLAAEAKAAKKKPAESAAKPDDATTPDKDEK